VPGVSVTILWPGGREWTGTAGVADVTTGEKLTVDTGFALGSISKTYTAANTLKLVEEGFLRLDDPAARYLPKLKLDRRITIRMLLEHTSGLHDFFLNPSIDRVLQGKPNATWTAAQALRYVRKPLLFPPGTKWAYSNTNYLLLGMIDEVADGRPLAIQLRARFLDPLELDHTWSQAAEAPRAATARGHRLGGSGTKRRAWPVFDGEPIMPFRSVVTAAGGAGEMAATSRDAARWMAALVLGDVLRPETRAEMVGAASYTNALGARLPYGLGVQVVELRNRPTIGHSGRLLGFRAVVRVLPEEGMTIAVLTNQGTVDPALIARSMLQLALPRVVTCGVCPRIL
jgi:D-alanyl-D-alanine carboxypeptidase